MLDLDGTGRISFIDTKYWTEKDDEGEKLAGKTYKLFTLVDGAYRLRKDRELCLAKEFRRGKGEPVIATEDLELSENSRYRLTVLNGLSNGRNRCSAAVIKVGEVTIVHPQDLNQSKYLFTHDVELSGEGPLSVELRSDVGCSVWVLIDHATPN